jgi:uncharacterized protein YcbK (DUF882 family)
MRGNFSVAQIEKDSWNLLTKAEKIAGFSIVVTSNYRNPEYNRFVGGVLNSAHTKLPCTAYDLSCSDSLRRFKLISALVEVGFKRIGIGKNHIHVDADLSKPQNVLWLE